ncbi:hypothetical protein ACPUVO_09110 [Pseudocolwellia sp. HL-MZ19]|uniref:hypothetical protein n=1 Tax=unclassified Pseudocolwellia TaxID=2848178 RepID=UPI003CEC61A9
MKLKTILLTSLISSSLVMASTSVMASDSKLKVAVIKNTAMSSEISKGEYQEIIASLSNTSSATEYNDFEKNTALCVAYLKTSNTVESEAACSSAIESAKTLETSSKRANYLKSISYSNRAVARYLKNDVVGAMSDLAVANSIDSNKISKINLEVMNSKLDQTSYDESVSLAD